MGNAKLRNNRLSAEILLYFSVKIQALKTLYDFLVLSIQFFLPLTAVFSPKMKLFVRGRKGVLQQLKGKFSTDDRVIWFHAASLGEYEQGLPVMQAIKKNWPEFKIVLTFFSPSGYEIRKNNPVADCTVYLPLDTPKNARQFVQALHPEWAVFIKYEVWPNYLQALQKQGAKTILFSGMFRESQLYFKAYGKFMREALSCFDWFFVQNEKAKKLLNAIDFENVSVSGDTRFDRVSHQIEIDNRLDFVEQFKQDSLCVVCGSTWPEDEKILLSYINASSKGVKFIIAPHEIKPQRIAQLCEKLHKKTVLYSKHSSKELVEADVLVIDTVGLLTKIYSYADIAYVGGAMGKTGLHNILEPATFGVPILIGPHHQKFPEAAQLRQLAGLFVVSSVDALKKNLDRLISDPHFRKSTGMISGHFVQVNTGATQEIITYFKNHFSK